MAKKTNKTSHVMDLLTNGGSADADTPVTEAVPGQEKKPSDVQSHTVTPAKVTVVDEGSRNDRLSQEILGKLTKELEEETRQEPQLQKQPSGDQEPNAPEADEPKAESQEPDAREAAVYSEPAKEEPSKEESQADVSPDQPAESVPESAAEASADVFAASEEVPKAEGPSGQKPQDTSVQKPERSDVFSGNQQPHPIIPESQLNNRFQDKEYRFINVMEQLLMRQNLEAVLTQYEVCTCPRCMSDVCALALTGLPSKYVVTSRDSISPLISYYENKYKIPVLTELMKACNKVRQNPRHKVKNN